MSLQCDLQYVCTQAGENGQDFIKKGVEWKWTELSDEITMATRTSAVQSREGGGGGGRMWEGVSCWRGLKWEGIALHFFYGFSGDSHGRGPSTHSNELFTHTYRLTHKHTHTHHYITDYNSYITRPCGHWGNYSLLTSAPAGQINKNAFFLFFFL